MGRRIAFLIAIVVSLFIFSGCLAFNHDLYVYYDFLPDTPKTTTVGSPMIEIKSVCQNDIYGNILYSFEQSLTYSGKQGNVIKVVYRELANNLARPAFSQELTYDLTDGPIIVFRNTKAKIIEATNSSITFVILETPAYLYKNRERRSCSTQDVSLGP